MEKLKVNEIFWSAQGEGTRKGISSIFLRLAGCSLGCSYCDSKSAWHIGEYFSHKEVVDKIQKIEEKYPLSQVVITGGEPLEQQIDNLVVMLKDKGLFVAIETNGNYYRNIPFDWWAVSPKDINDFRINDKLWKKISEIKLIVNENLNFDIVRSISKKDTKTPVFLQPQFPDQNRFEKTFKLFEECISGGISNVRLGVQMHRSFNIR